MLQKFIDNTFYYLFVFTLFFGVMFYDAIATATDFKFTDELCTIALLALYIYKVFHTKNWSVNKQFLLTLAIFLFYFIYSIIIGSNTKSGIFTDFIIQLKPYIAFFTVYAFSPRFNNRMKFNLKFFCILFASYLLILGCVYFVNLNIFLALIEHQSRLATAATILALLYLFCSDYTKKNKIIFLIILSIGLLSGRSKIYGFFVLSFFAIVYINKSFQLTFNKKNIILFTLSIILMLIVTWDKINLYFIQGGISMEANSQDLYARAALYYFSIPIITDYFPFGPGFATYATYASGEYYSHIYSDYGMDMLYGLTKANPAFVSDTYYPALAQFGIVGIILFFLFWTSLLHKACKLYNPQFNIKEFVISILIVIFFIIECTSDATITHNRGLFMMMLLAMSLRSMQYKLENKGHENTNS